jgi:hypothetical protein
VGKYLAGHRGRTPDPSQRWLTLVHHHAQTIVACDFFVAFTSPKWNFRPPSSGSTPGGSWTERATAQCQSSFRQIDKGDMTL